MRAALTGQRVIYFQTKRENRPFGGRTAFERGLKYKRGSDYKNYFIWGLTLKSVIIIYQKRFDTRDKTTNITKMTNEICAILTKEIKALKTGESKRRILSEARKVIREAGDGAEYKGLFDSDSEGIDLILDCLDSEDAKTRKNAALLIDDLRSRMAMPDSVSETVRDRLFNAYLSEETCFVRPDILKALSSFDCALFKGKLKERLEEIRTPDENDPNLVHIRSERRELEKIIEAGEEADGRPFFKGFDGRPYEMILLCDREYRDAAAEITGHGARPVPMGVRVSCGDYSIIEKCRLWKDALFMIPRKKDVVLDERSIFHLVENTGIMRLIDRMSGSGGSECFRFRLEITGSSSVPGTMVKKIASALEESSKGRLLNIAGNYQFTIVLREKENRFIPYIRTRNEWDKRFDYRKNTEPTSMTGVSAACFVETVRPFLKKDAEIMDPFCGVGTLLIERDKAVRAREIYGTDTYGHAIAGGRENADRAGVRINFINRNFFDFRHDYLFDEIITEMPDLYGRTIDEKNKFMKRFFESADRITNDGAVIMILTGESSLIKKYIRLTDGFHMENSFAFQNGRMIYVIGKR